MKGAEGSAVTRDDTHGIIICHLCGVKKVDSTIVCERAYL
jgi:hypothetical protein